MVLHKGLWAGSAVSERGRGGEGSGAWKEEADPSRLPLLTARLTALPEIIAETFLVCTQRWLV